MGILLASEQTLSRKVELIIRFVGMDITESIMPDLLSFSYSDNSGDELDDLQIKIADRDKKWLNGWLNEAIIKAAATYNAQVTMQTTAYRVTNANGIKVRTGAGTEYAESGFLSFGSTVYVISKEGGWAKILLAGKEQYVTTNGIKEVPSSEGMPYDTTKKITGMKISAMIVRRNWNGDGKDDVLDCGELELDSLEASAPPNTVTIKATALPYRSNIRQTKKTRAWDNYTLQMLARDIASESGMYYLNLSSAPDKRYDRIEQYEETDVSLLKRLCNNNGIGLKFSTNIMVLYDVGSATGNTVVLDGNAVEATGYKLNAGKAQREYQSCRVSYTDPKTGTVISGTAYVDGYDAADPANTQLEIKCKCANIFDAQNYAEIRLKEANKYAKTATVTVPGGIFAIAGGKAQLKNYGAWDGMHTILSVNHQIDSGGYETQITMSKDQS